MPPTVEIVLDGGTIAAISASVGGAVGAVASVIGVLWRKYETERTARNTEALAAAKELYEERRSSDRAKDIIERRDDRIADLQHDIAQLERALERCEQRQQTPMPPRLEAGP